MDSNLDPELALALRISLEEERARQESITRAEGGGDAAQPSGTEAAAAGGVDDDLARALAMSQGESGEDVQMEDLSEEEQIARAIALSMGGGDGEEAVS
jgi:26S proteasome regulatory subunit N10